MQPAQRQASSLGDDDEGGGADARGFGWSGGDAAGDMKEEIAPGERMIPYSCGGSDNSWFVNSHSEGDASRSPSLLQLHSQENCDFSAVIDSGYGGCGGLDPTESTLSLHPHPFHPHYPPYFSSLFTAVCNYPFDDNLELLRNSGFSDTLAWNSNDAMSSQGLSSQMRLAESDLGFLMRHTPADNGAAAVSCCGFGPASLDGYGAMAMKTLDSPPSGMGTSDLNLLRNRSIMHKKSDSGEPCENLMLSEYDNNDGVEISNATSSAMDGGDPKGKKKGRPPAKNLMAERRRRKKLNDRLFMLRSIVPKISKMDRASILADAIDYLKDLLQRIKCVNDELQSLASAGSSMTFPVKKEYRKTALSSPTNQPPMVQVEVREDNAFNIHMFCSCRPGLLLSAIRALDSLGMDIHQAVISSVDGFALDVFRAEKCKRVVDVHPDEIKTALLDTAAFHGLV